ncbi:hypothetical protein IHE45_03G055200 [Dioscorea alata]|uniref:Uncharacterized protein n=1 Tax=Dioscorea alata TaxID=55571 RepID=A0ACB7WKH3_DIOAL|nr:hypothetical protein IHE45_03G055200 [Dioscorea alata]
MSSCATLALCFCQTSYAHQLIFSSLPLFIHPPSSQSPNPSHTQSLPLTLYFLPHFMAPKLALFALASFLLVTAKVSSFNEEHVFMGIEDVGVGKPLNPPVVYPAPTPAPAPAGPIMIKTWKGTTFTVLVSYVHNITQRTV